MKKLRGLKLKMNTEVKTSGETEPENISLSPFLPPPDPSNTQTPVGVAGPGKENFFFFTPLNFFFFFFSPAWQKNEHACYACYVKFISSLHRQ